MVCRNGLVRRIGIVLTLLQVVLCAPSVVLAQQAEGSTMAISFEAVDKYHGMQVGEIFADEPAPRILARYTRATSAGNFYLDSWNSFGNGFNLESDIGVGWARKGWDVSYVHFAVRGGDIAQFAISKSGGIKLGARPIGLSASVIHYAKVRPSSPPGGTLVRLSAGTRHSLPGKCRSLVVNHDLTLGADNNPFGLGEGRTLLGFYRVEAGWKGTYFGWNASVPLAGAGNTTRGFRNSFSTGYRHVFNW